MTTVTTLCSVCFELIDNLAWPATTQCCWEPICRNCAETWQFQDHGDFVCGNCQGITSLDQTNTLTEAIAHFQVAYQERYAEVVKTAQSRLDQLVARQAAIDLLTTKLAANLTKLTAKSSTSHHVTAIESYQQAYIKTIQLAQADQQQMLQRARAHLKYLARLNLNSSLALAAKNQPAQLLQLDQALSLSSARLIAITPAPRYQEMRWFNHRLVSDDLPEQFQALVEAKPRHRVIYSNLAEHLVYNFGLTVIDTAIVIELPAGLADLTQSSQSIDQPAYLTCYSYFGGPGYAIVDQNGQVVYNRAHELVAITKTWLVTLIREANESKYLQVESLVEVLNQPPSYRVRANLACEPNQSWLSPSPRQLKLSLNNRALNSRVFGQIISSKPDCDHLVVCYDWTVNPTSKATNKVCTSAFTNWSLALSSAGPIAELQYQTVLDLGHRVRDFSGTTVIIAITNQRNNNYYRTYLSLTGQLSPYQREAHGGWRLLNQGYFMRYNHQGAVLVWPDGETGESVAAVDLAENYTLSLNNWDGRLVKIRLGSTSSWDQGDFLPQDDNQDIILDFY